MCWYMILCQVSPVAELTASLLVPHTGLTWYRTLYHHIMYIICIYNLGNKYKLYIYSRTSMARTHKGPMKTVGARGVSELSGLKYVQI